MGMPGGRSRATILVVDDDAELAATLAEFVAQEGYPVETALSASEALLRQERNPHIALALVDLMMPGVDGLSLMTQLQRHNPDLAVIIMTGFGTIETAVDAIKRGAEDYLTKPFDREAIRKKIGRLYEVFELRERVAELEATGKGALVFENFVSISSAMRKVLDRARAAAANDASILLLGETGTGKEMLARAIHAASPRAQRAFVPINCAALPRDLVESELFGFRRGAFTGAHADHPGIFAAASGGTVFLDEIGEMPKDAQVKLLRVLQEGELRPIGSATSVRIDVRVIAATNRPLASLRGEHMRDDLYYRIATVLLELPPLRTRPEDLIVLAQHFAGRAAARHGRQISLSRPALDAILAYSFPGNVRELEHIIEAAAVFSADDPQVITDADLRPLTGGGSEAAAPAGSALSMAQAEQMAIEQALRACDGNRTRAASMLGISRDTLYRKLRQRD